MDDVNKKKPMEFRYHRHQRQSCVAIILLLILQISFTCCTNHTVTQYNNIENALQQPNETIKSTQIDDYISSSRNQVTIDTNNLKRHKVYKTHEINRNRNKNVEMNQNKYDNKNHKNSTFHASNKFKPDNSNHKPKKNVNLYTKQLNDTQNSNKYWNGYNHIDYQSKRINSNQIKHNNFKPVNRNCNKCRIIPGPPVRHKSYYPSSRVTYRGMLFYCFFSM